MQIISRYRCRCRVCFGTIIPGDKIEWDRGLGSCHTRCHTKAVEKAEEIAKNPGRAVEIARPIQGRLL